MDGTRTLRDILTDVLLFHGRMYPDLTLTGPIYIGTSEQSPAEKSVRTFLEHYTSVHAPYLANSFHRRLDIEIEARAKAAHFAVTAGASVAGLLRVRCGAFEFEHLAAELLSVSGALRGHAEYSRLMVLRDWRASPIGRMLVAYATLWVLASGSAPGIVALCRRGSAKVFRQYGLRPYSTSTVCLAERDDGAYTLMAATWRAIQERLETHPPVETRARLAQVPAYLRFTLGR